MKQTGLKQGLCVFFLLLHAAFKSENSPLRHGRLLWPNSCMFCQSPYLPIDAQESCFKRMLKFTLKQLLHVSLQSPSSGNTLFELAEVIVVKVIC